MGDDRPFVCTAPGCGQVWFLNILIHMHVSITLSLTFSFLLTPLSYYMDSLQRSLQLTLQLRWCTNGIVLSRTGFMVPDLTVDLLHGKQVLLFISNQICQQHSGHTNDTPYLLYINATLLYFSYLLCYYLQRFTNEDHLSVHKHKHEMTLKFGPARTDSVIIAGNDNTIYISVCWMKTSIYMLLCCLLGKRYFCPLTISTNIMYASFFFPRPDPHTHTFSEELWGGWTIQWAGQFLWTGVLQSPGRWAEDKTPGEIKDECICWINGALVVSSSYKIKIMSWFYYFLVIWKSLLIFFWLLSASKAAPLQTTSEVKDEDEGPLQVDSSPPGSPDSSSSMSDNSRDSRVRGAVQGIATNCFNVARTLVYRLTEFLSWYAQEKVNSWPSMIMSLFPKRKLSAIELSADNKFHCLIS